MEFQEIAERAYKRIGPDKFWNLPERYAYLKLEDLYYKYRLGNISKEKSIIEKQKIEKEYNWDKQQYENALNVYKTYNENRIKSEILLAEVEKATDKEMVALNCFKVIANFISDDSFVERNLQKFKQLDF